MLHINPVFGAVFAAVVLLAVVLTVVSESSSKEVPKWLWIPSLVTTVLGIVAVIVVLFIPAAWGAPDVTTKVTTYSAVTAAPSEGFDKGWVSVTVLADGEVSTVSCRTENSEFTYGGTPSLTVTTVNTTHPDALILARNSTQKTCEFIVTEGSVFTPEG